MNNSPKYWLACSGGVDSVVLLHLMYETNKDVGILHCNFHLRGESSDGDEEFVRNLAEELGFQIRVKQFDTKKYSRENNINTQLAARELRYNWFEEIIQNEGGIVLLAHHYDDQLETFFLQLRRGGKVKGLAGMPVFRDGYLRPLLKYSKNELIELAIKNSWKWREDITNTFNDYTRNWYRNEVLPALNNASFPLSDVVPLIHSFQKIVAFLSCQTIPNSISIKKWFTFPIWFKDFILSEQGLGEYSVNEIDRLAETEKGKFIGNEVVKVWNEGNELVFVKEKQSSLEYKIQFSTHLINEVEYNNVDLFVDVSKVQGQLFTRKWQAGDRFQPLGMKGEKLVGKFLRDRKVPAHQKEDIQVLLDEKGQVIGVFGFGVGERFKVEGSSKTLVIVKLISS